MLKISKEYPFSKVGVYEVEGLRDTLRALATPLKKHLEERAYWSEIELQDAEYKGRDGFIPYPHNCGGIQISLSVPKCEEYNFDFLGFGECDECTAEKQCGFNGQECGSESEGHLDSHLRIWLKFEGIDDKGVMSFYFYLGGGNDDAPYFRIKHEPTIFEESFQAIDLKQLRKTGGRIVRKMLRKMGAV